MKKVAVIMGSDSDLPVVEKCIDELKKYGIPTEVHVYSAHRTPDEAIGFAKTAEENGFGVIISAAGKAAHLGGVLAANTVLPVVGIPIKASALDGMDALLSTVQMPPAVSYTHLDVYKRQRWHEPFAHRNRRWTYLRRSSLWRNSNSNICIYQ